VNSHVRKRTEVWDKLIPFCLRNAFKRRRETSPSLY
jgi:hypothetical protein